MTATQARAKEYCEAEPGEQRQADASELREVGASERRAVDERAGPVHVLIVESAGPLQPWIDPLARAAFPHKALLVARSLREALAALKQYPCDLVLVDLQLPDGSGIQIIEEAARISPQAHCIVVTTFDDDEHIFGSLTAGAKGYLLKDQPQQILLEQLRQLAHGVPALSAFVTRRLVDHFSRTSQRREDDPLVLSRRERDVLCLVARGQRIAEAASALHISTHTVCSHIKNIYRKLGVSSRAQAALQAQKMGLV